MTSPGQADTGLFVSIDGPGGVGKTALAVAAVRQLAARGRQVHLTREPSPTPLGEIIRSGTGTYRGLALACLVAGDRHHHLSSEIRPHRDAGQVVLCDRYLPSSLVLQRIDGIAWETIITLNDGADLPALAIILNADPAVIAARLARRGGHSRFEAMPGSSQAESALYRETAQRLAGDGWPVWCLDAASGTPDQLAAAVTARILTLHPAVTRSLRDHHRPVPANPEHRQPVR
jgi:dTMP kinase